MDPQGFRNLTPFAAETLILLDEDGAEVVTLVSRATYALEMDGSLTLLADQPPVVKAPVFHGAPLTSSLKLETEAVPHKPATDVILLGHAQPDHGLAPEVLVDLSVGPIRKQVRVFGDRTWKRTLGIFAPTAPKPFERMPLVYERAFGGWDRSSPDAAMHRADPKNPVGVGFLRPDADREVEGLALPNLEVPDELVKQPGDRPPPAGFGYIAADWAPRKQDAGTFDEAWRQRRFPKLPVDFDRRHFNAAPRDQQVAGYLRGGEAVSVQGASHRGRLRFSIPTARPEGHVRIRRDPGERVPMHLDTLIIDADQHRVTVIHRGSLKAHRRVHDLRETRIEIPGRHSEEGLHARSR